MKQTFKIILFIFIFTYTLFFNYHPIEGNASSVLSIPQSEDTLSLTADIPQEGRYDAMLDSVIGPLTYYNQSDSRWGNYLYGGKDPLSIYGCGPTVMAMLITSFTGKQVSPIELANWAAQNNGWCPGEGSYHRLIPDSAAAYGLTSAPLKDFSIQGLKEALESGHLIVALMKKGHFTQEGHFIIITRVTDDGKIRIADSNNFSNSFLEWEPTLIFNELNYNSRNGGPLWTIGLSTSP